MKILPCPNPECDPEDGCCICEHSGRIYEYVLEDMQVEAQNVSAHLPSGTR